MPDKIQDASYHMRQIYTTQLLVVYLKFKFNWASYISVYEMKATPLGATA